MTVDFASRKLAKKRAKQGRQAEKRSYKSRSKEEGANDDEAPKRVRTKARGPNHVIRNGACFKPPPLPPALAAEDAAAAEAALAARSGPTRRQRKRARALAGDAPPPGDDDGGEEKAAAAEAEAAELRPPPRASQPPPPSPPAFSRALRRLGHAAPTWVQLHAWAALGCSAQALAQPPGAPPSSRGTVAVAPPGTGKTLAFLLPLLVFCSSAGGDAACSDAASRAGPDCACAPLALAVLPARELARQVARAARAAAAALRPPKTQGELLASSGDTNGGAISVSVGLVHGGASLDDQAARLRAARPSLLVGTPGRVRALLEAGALSLASVACLCLDEADKLLADAACCADLEALCAGPHGLPGAERRAISVLTTATLPERVASAAAAWAGEGCVVIRQPAATEGGDDGGGGDDGDRAGGDSQPPAAPPDATAAHAVQRVSLCAEHKKPRKLLRYLDALRAGEAASRARAKCRVLVFTNTIAGAREVRELLRRHGHTAGLLHGSLPQARARACPPSTFLSLLSHLPNPLPPSPSFIPRRRATPPWTPSAAARCRCLSPPTWRVAVCTSPGWSASFSTTFRRRSRRMRTEWAEQDAPAAQARRCASSHARRRGWRPRSPGCCETAATMWRRT